MAAAVTAVLAATELVPAVLVQQAAQQQAVLAVMAQLAAKQWAVSAVPAVPAAQLILAMLQRHVTSPAVLAHQAATAVMLLAVQLTAVLQ